MKRKWNVPLPLIYWIPPLLSNLHPNWRSFLEVISFRIFKFLFSKWSEFLPRRTLNPFIYLMVCLIQNTLVVYRSVACFSTSRVSTVQSPSLRKSVFYVSLICFIGKLALKCVVCLVFQTRQLFSQETSEGATGLQLVKVSVTREINNPAPCLENVDQKTALFQWKKVKSFACEVQKMKIEYDWIWRLKIPITFASFYFSGANERLRNETFKFACHRASEGSPGKCTAGGSYN